jgi:hypothetical protein
MVKSDALLPAPNRGGLRVYVGMLTGSQRLLCTLSLHIIHHNVKLIWTLLVMDLHPTRPQVGRCVN